MKKCVVKLTISNIFQMLLVFVIKVTVAIHNTQCTHMMVSKVCIYECKSNFRQHAHTPSRSSSIKKECMCIREECRAEVTTMPSFQESSVLGKRAPSRSPVVYYNEGLNKNHKVDSTSAPFFLDPCEYVIILRQENKYHQRLHFPQDVAISRSF